jgi:hypothetical protein
MLFKAIKSAYSEIEWRLHPIKENKEKLWGKRVDTDEWIETVYVRTK